MTEIQGVMTDLITLIAHPAEVLSSSNQGHRRLLAAVAVGTRRPRPRAMLEHLRGTEHILAGLLPAAAAACRRGKPPQRATCTRQARRSSRPTRRRPGWPPISAGPMYEVAAHLTCAHAREHAAAKEG